MQSEHYDMCGAFILLSTRIQQVEEERGGEEGGDPVSGNISHRTLRYLNRAGHFQLRSPYPCLVSYNDSGRTYQSDSLAIYVCVCVLRPPSRVCSALASCRPSCSQASCLAASCYIAAKHCVENQHAGFWTIHDS